MTHDYIPFLTAALWPATVLILTFGFRKSINQVIESIAELRLWGDKAVVRWGHAKVDSLGIEVEATTAPPPKQLSAPLAAKWDRPADIFWLGSDLETTAQAALRGAAKDRIVRGLRQSHHHLSEIGLGDSAPGRQLASLKEQVAILPDAILDRQWRNDFASKIHSIIQVVSDLARTAQPNFRSHPE